MQRKSKLLAVGNEQTDINLLYMYVFASKQQ